MNQQSTSKRCVYIFLDEGGNLDFSKNGTQYFTLSCVTIQRPFVFYQPLEAFRYDLIEWGLDTEYFHCTCDNTHVREKIFSLIADACDAIRVDSIVVEKRKTAPTVQDYRRFYPEMLGYLLRYVIERVNGEHIDEIIVITDSIPLASKKKAIEKAIKQTLASMIPVDCQYRVLHHASKAHLGLQIADYCNWAIFRKWERGDQTYCNKIKHCIKSEFAIFRNGSVYYY